MNTVNIIGRLASEIEVRQTNGGKSVGNGTLAVDEGYGDQKKTLWIGFTIWDKQAEAMSEHAVKGQKLAITGWLSQEEYTPKGQDKPVRKTGVTVTSFDFLEKPKGGQHDPAPPRERGFQQTGQPGSSRPTGGAPAPQGEYHEEDDIPF